VDIFLHDWLRAHVRRADGVLLGIGHDCAVVRWGNDRLALKTDPVIEGVHFEVGTPAASIARKAFGRALSDLAAVAAEPKYSLLSIVFPQTATERECRRILAALALAAQRCGAPVIGGHTGFAGDRLQIHLTLAGVCFAPSPGRAGAKAGDALLCTGSFGGSILGRHIRPSPRIREMRAICAAVRVHAAIDVSDGLSLDLARVCQASKLGAILYGDSIPIARAAARRATKTGRTPLWHALSDGEDYELLLAVPRADAPVALAVARRRGFALTHVGEFTKRRGLWLESQGHREMLQPAGHVNRSNQRKRPT
jgi:thiamine-monophosphate kinase